MADKKKSKLPEKLPDKSELPVYKGDDSLLTYRGYEPDRELEFIYRYGYDKNDDALTKLLQRRMKRNEEMGLQVSPEDTAIQYGELDDEFYGGNTQGYVRSDRPKEINISPLLRKTPKNPNANEDSLKYTLAHELQHVNQLANKDKKSHENDRYISLSGQSSYLHEGPSLLSVLTGNSKGQGYTEDEELRRIRSLVHPRQVRREIESWTDKSKPSDKTVFDVREVIKYAKEQGVPIDDIIDAMTINAALGSDKLAREAHEQTRKNQEVGRGILGDVGLEKPMSTEEVYKPWKEMKEKRKNKK